MTEKSRLCYNGRALGAVPPITILWKNLIHQMAKAGWQFQARNAKATRRHPEFCVQVMFFHPAVGINSGWIRGNTLNATIGKASTEAIRLMKARGLELIKEIPIGNRTS